MRFGKDFAGNDGARHGRLSSTSSLRGARLVLEIRVERGFYLAPLHAQIDLYAFCGSWEARAVLSKVAGEICSKDLLTNLAPIGKRGANIVKSLGVNPASLKDIPGCATG